MDEQEKKHDNFWLSEMIRNTLSVCNKGYGDGDGDNRA